MKLKLENISVATNNDPIESKEEDQINILSAVRELIVACKWDVRYKINISVDEDSIQIYRELPTPKYTLDELLKKCG